MRPSVLNPLFADITTLKGVGPKLVGLFQKLLGRPAPRVIDLLFHAPSNIVDRSLTPRLVDATPGTIVTVAVTVDRHRPPPPGRSKAPHLVYTHDESQDLVLTWFRMPAGRIEQMLPVGETRYVSGKLELFDGRLQMVHPDRVVDEAGLAKLPKIEAVYPGTEGLAASVLRRAIAGAVEKCPDLPEWHDQALQQRHRFPAFRAAVAALHAPDGPALDPKGPAWARLAYDELLANQLALQIVRAAMRRGRGRASQGDGRLRQRIEAVLPFSLTGSQRQAVEDIARDMAGDRRMIRLLQGDVGSGKTVVALMAAAIAAEAGRQTALMAPTEILARQHLERLAPLAEKVGMRIAFLSGREKGAGRAATLRALAQGDIHLIVGTHALLQDDVEFEDLALAIVDEQHRFGVDQRLALSAKGEAVDLLVMTATPIPRTLVLSYFGDMDVSALTEKPAGRQPIDTRVIPLDRLDEVVAGVGRALAEGRRCYWVAPLVEENEELDLAAAEERAEDLRKVFGPELVELVHGRMRASEKDTAMGRFQRGEARVLVATTVIEVGVDVPEASIMVIEHAERFGLSQLHQLRGRVGRGSARSTCLLLYRGPLGETAKRRLQVIRDTEDGFLIAEEDLKLRGEGDVLGTRQSGMPGFRVARLEHHAGLLAMARDDAALALQRDPTLSGERGSALRHLLYLYERDEAFRTLASG